MLDIDHLDYQTIHQMSYWINWYELSKTPLREAFMREFADYVDWNMISLHQHHASDEFIREFAERLDWGYISLNDMVSEQIIREFSERINWDFISDKLLSESLIREFAHRVNWTIISANRQMTIQFMMEFIDYVDWDEVSKCHALTDELCVSFFDRLNWYEIAQRDSISFIFIQKFNAYLPRTRRVLGIIRRATVIQHMLAPSAIPDEVIINIIQFCL